MAANDLERGGSVGVRRSPENPMKIRKKPPRKKVSARPPPRRKPQVSEVIRWKLYLLGIIPPMLMSAVLAAIFKESTLLKYGIGFGVLIGSAMVLNMSGVESFPWRT